MKADTMERWLFTFFLGALLSLFLPIVPTIFYVFLFLCMALLFLLHKSLKNFSGLFFGIAWIIFNGANYQQVWQGNDINVDAIHLQSKRIVGRVISIPTFKNNIQRFNFRISHWNKTLLVNAIDVRLSFKEEVKFVKQGQVWQFDVKLKPAHGLANAGGFQYQTWLRAKNIVATGYIVKSKFNQLLNANTSTRQQLIDNFQDKITESPLSPLFYALAFGERGQITSQQWQVLQSTNTQHLIAISGLHLGLITSFCYFFIILVFKFIPTKLITATTANSNAILRIYLIVNIPLVALCISVFFACFYAYISGFALPTVRALLMLLLVVLVKLVDIKMTVLRWLLSAIFLIIIVSPFSLLSASFWLSLYAVTVIFFVFWRFSPWAFRGNKFAKYLKILLLMQIYLTLAMLPIVALFNQHVSLVSFIANVIAVPWMSFTSIPLSILSVVAMPISESLSLALFDLALLSLQVIWTWLAFLTEHTWAIIRLSAQDNLFLTFLVAAFLLLTLTIKNIRTTLVTTISIIVITAFVIGKPSTSWKINVLDVGQGLAIVIEKNAKTIIYDTGANFPSGFNMAQAVLLPYLSYRGSTHVDMLVISHNDNDHAGGLKHLVENITVLEIVQNRSDKQNISSDSFCFQGNKRIWQGLTIEVLWPTNDYFSSQRVSDNDSSCVLRISDGNISLLLTGDISRKVETSLVANSDISADILIAPHHGSKTSSSQSFINAVKPQYVVFTTGFLNRWNMPHQSVIQRYQKSGVKIYNTALDGMVQFEVLPESVDVSSYRKDFWPFWFAN